MTPAVLVLGVGNELRHDDAVGLEVVRRARALAPPASRADLAPAIEYREHEGETLALLGAVGGSRRGDPGRRDPWERARRHGAALRCLPPAAPGAFGGLELHARDRRCGRDRAGTRAWGACRDGSSSTGSRARASTPAAGSRRGCSRWSKRSPDACWRRPSDWPPRPPARRRSRRRWVAGRAARGRSGRAP